MLFSFGRWAQIKEPKDSRRCSTVGGGRSRLLGTDVELPNVCPLAQHLLLGICPRDTAREWEQGSVAEPCSPRRPRDSGARRRRVPAGVPARPVPHAGSRVSTAAWDSSPSTCFRGKVSVARFSHLCKEGACVCSAGRDPQTERGAAPGDWREGRNEGLLNVLFIARR